MKWKKYIIFWLKCLFLFQWSLVEESCIDLVSLPWTFKTEIGYGKFFSISIHFSTKKYSLIKEKREKEKRGKELGNQVFASNYKSRCVQIGWVISRRRQEKAYSGKVQVIFGRRGVKYSDFTYFREASEYKILFL